MKWKLHFLFSSSHKSISHECDVIFLMLNFSLFQAIARQTIKFISRIFVTLPCNLL